MEVHKGGCPRAGAALRHQELGSCLAVFQGMSSTQPDECPHGTGSVGPTEGSASVMVLKAPPPRLSLGTAGGSHQLPHRAHCVLSTSVLLRLGDGLCVGEVRV